MDHFQIIRFNYTDSQLMSSAFVIREQVFIKEQNVPVDLERDSYDMEAIHYILYDGETPLAAARRRRTDKGIKLERFAVLSDHRNRGLGSSILKYVLKDIQDERVLIYLNSQEAAVPFYERHGFKKKGKAFMEAGIRHYMMIYNA